MDYLQIGNTKIEYDLITSNRTKTIELVIDFKKGFTVKAPKCMSKEEIIKHLHRKEKWIILNLDKMSEIFKNEINKEFVSGEKFLFRGKRYSLKVIRSNSKLPSLEFKKSKFHAIVPSQFSEQSYKTLLRPLFIKFYKKEAEKIIQERVKKYLNYFKIKPKKVIITELKNNWGSCSKNNELRYNWRIIFANTSIIDYVIVHELCHMIEKNHSDAYWNEIKKIILDYEKRKNWLRSNGDLLKI